MPLPSGPERVVAAALAEWRSVVRDPSPRITDYIRSGLGWTWVSSYTRRGQFEWCGAFAAHCYAQAGASAAARRLRYASTYRLGATEARLGAPLPEVSLDALDLGDILVITRDGAPAWGHHICVVLGVEGGIARTVEGNATGQLGDGTIDRGVILRTRPLRRRDAGGRCELTGLAQGAWAHRAWRPPTVGGDGGA